GGNLGVLVEIHQDLINSTVGQSVLLPVSYRFSGAPRFPVSIVWMFTNSTDTLITCTVLNCSLGANGAPHGCSAKCFPGHRYRGRAELFPENGSLLLRDLQLGDSGVYGVTFRPSHQTWHVTLTVHEPRSTPEHAGTELGGGGTATRIPCYVFGGYYCFILLFLQLLFHL
ncbi:HECAM protein, partial [Fregata magnificens]|nr:HECAM protein [Fregata magnificens]